MRTSIIVLLVGLAADSLATNAVGQAFLAENLKKTGIGVLQNGLQLKVCSLGTGTTSPLETTEVTFHYAGWSVEEYQKSPKGFTFSSSFERDKPVTSTLADTNLILGLAFAMTIMRAGDVFELYVPAELAYGDKGTEDGLIKPDEVIIITLQLLEVKAGGRAYRELPAGVPVGGCDPIPEVGVKTGPPSFGLVEALIFFGAVLGVGVICALLQWKKKRDVKKALKGASGGAPPGAPLPAGWEEQQDPGTGRTYFYNTLDGSTVWTRPTQPAGAANYT